jgi:hypothetical protein
VPVYRSSISGQLAGFEREVRGIMTRVLFAGGNRFRTRMKRERLSGPPGLYARTGRLRRSLRLDRKPLGSTEVGVFYAIGGGMAPYAAEHEANGRLGFRRVWGEEAAKTIEELKMALRFVRGRGGKFGGAIGGLEGAIATVGAASAEDLINDANWAEARGGTGEGNVRGNAKRQMAGLIRWHDRTLAKFRKRAGTGGVRVTSGQVSAAQVNWASAKQGMDYRLHKLSVLTKRTRARITRGLRRRR